VDIWLVRHGESTWNSERRFQGERDAPLSERGREQAAAVARALAGTSFGALYTSPLSRARDTAAACAATLGLAPTPVDDLREMSLGDWEGLTVEAVVEREGDHYWRWLTSPADHPPPGGEPVERFQGRVAAALARLTARHPDESVLAVTHGGVIAGFLCRCLGLGPNALWRLRIENTSVTRVSLPAGHLRALNDTRHLVERGVPAVAAAP
jgi:broad specificity phosphatase PhoE